MITKFFFVRHGKSEASALGIVQGQGLHIPLTEEGRRQAEVLGQGLRGFSFDLMFTSEARRAIETADIVRKFLPRTCSKIPCVRFAELNERSKGVAEGMKKEEFEKRWPEIREAWEQEIDARPEGGENFEDVHHRVVPLIERHMKEYAGKTLLYVTHGNIIRTILGYMLGTPYALRARLKQDYCVCNIASYDHEKRRWEVECMNKGFSL